MPREADADIDLTNREKYQKCEFYFFFSILLKVGEVRYTNYFLVSRTRFACFAELMCPLYRF